MRAALRRRGTPAAEGRFREAERRMWASVGLQPSERSVRLASTGTHVRVQEVGDGSPILLVHGASNSGVSWAPLVAQLQGFRCLVLDRPGCGLSEPLGRRLAHAAALRAFAEAVLVDVLDALDVPRAHLVATSYGGHLAFRTAAAHADRVERVVALGWSVGAPARAVPLVMRVAGVPALGRAMAALPAPERAVRAMLAQVGLRQGLATGRVGPEVVRSFRSLLNDTATMRNELVTGPRSIRLGGMDPSITLDDALGGVTAPVLLLWGEDDPFGGPEEARRFASALPHARLELLPGHGHAVWLDDPEHVGARVRSFLG